MIYRLLRSDGEVECEVDALDAEDALAALSSKVGKALAFDGPGAPDYRMQAVEANQVAWRSRDGRPVFVVRPPSK